LRIGGRADLRRAVSDCQGEFGERRGNPPSSSPRGLTTVMLPADPAGRARSTRERALAARSFCSVALRSLTAVALPSLNREVRLTMRIVPDPRTASRRYG